MPHVLPETDPRAGETGLRESPRCSTSPLSELSREHTQTIRSEGYLPNDEPDRAGETISSYRIEHLLGMGGMGFVYQAEQRAPRRAVALKVMRHGHRVDEVHARLFQREAETLARLRHPNIAAIYESGHTEDGRDFFAMELVEGQTLDAWLDAGHATSTVARLRLFQAICKPVHYAHQRGVIHHDLKPKNIMILEDPSATGDDHHLAAPVVKILDFGLARVTDPDLHSADDERATPAVVGTLPYMSPEQARADLDAIDLRTDVYSLGVILYELLTGKRPYVLDTSLSSAVETICTAEPQLMLERSNPSRLVDRELQAIVCTALAKDPDQRYGTVAALDDDIERYLSSLPIAAYGTSRRYRLGKLVRRNRLWLITAAVLTFALVAGIAGTTTGLLRARLAEQMAREEAETSQRVSSFLADILASVDAEALGQVLVSELEAGVVKASEQPGAPEGSQLALETLRSISGELNATDIGRSVLDAAILSRAGSQIEARFSAEPVLAAELHHTLAETYERLGLHVAALAHAERAVATRAQSLGPEAPETLRSQALLGTLFYRDARYDPAEELLSTTWQAQRRTIGEDHPDTLRTALSRAWVMIANGQLAPAETLLETTLAYQRRVLGDTHRDTMSTMNSLAVVHTNRGHYGEAEALHSALLELRTRILGPTDTDTLKSMTNLAVVCYYQQRLDDAANLFSDVLGIQRQQLGPTHPSTLATANNLAVIYQQQERYAEAEKLHRWTLQEKRRALGDDHAETLSSLYNLAIVYTAQHRFDAAEAAHQQVFENRRRTLGPSHPQTLTALSALAGLAALQGDTALALRRLEIAVEGGYADTDTLTTDADFESLRRDPQFVTLIERARSNGES